MDFAHAAGVALTSGVVSGVTLAFVNDWRWGKRSSIDIPRRRLTPLAWTLRPVGCGGKMAVEKG
jgi:hypothetical protein